MNQMIQWNPLAQLASMTRGWPTFNSSSNGDATGLPDWVPSVDIFEHDKAYVIKMDLPEVRREDIDVELEGTVLTVRGLRKAEKEEKSRKYHRVERSCGAFSRSFELPDDIESAGVEATFKDGVLTVQVAKAAHAQPKRVAISVN